MGPGTVAAYGELAEVGNCKDCGKLQSFAFILRAIKACRYCNALILLFLFFKRQSVFMFCVS